MTARHRARAGSAALCLLIATAMPPLAAAKTPPPPVSPRAASPATVQAQQALAATLPFADRQDIEFASRGFLGTLPDGRIRNAAGALVRDLNDSAIPAGEAPPEVNPSLWRNAQLVSKHGLFQVADGLWQVRGFDLANMTIIRGQSGYIIVDPLTMAETARAALDLVRATQGDRPVVAVIYTHSHVDHYGGARGVVDPADVAAGRVQVIAPKGFLEHAVSENVIAGNAMSRRAAYMFGYGLAVGATGTVSAGIGPAFTRGTAPGTISLVPPTREISRTGETVTVDGVTIEFQLTPDTEAPAEMNFYLPAWKALCLAENANGAMHNILTPRGALVRDAKGWADYLTQALRLYGDRAELVFTSHYWPRWGNAVLRDYIASHRDAYKYLHDQSVRLMNMGLNGTEIAETIRLPDSLARRWFNRGNYGTMSHNAKAVYQRYMGWYDGNPVNLEPLPPEEAARRYVAAMGGARAVLASARKAHAAGDDRWAAELLGRLVFAEPANRAARDLLADALEQLGYRAESGPWRNIYLSGAWELRQNRTVPTFQAGGDAARALPVASVLDLLAVRLNPERATDQTLSFNLVIPAAHERHLVRVANSVLVHESDADDPQADATMVLEGPMGRLAFLGLISGQTTAAQLMESGVLKIDGDPTVLARFATLFDKPPADFGLVMP